MSQACVSLARLTLGNSFCFSFPIIARENCSLPRVLSEFWAWVSDTAAVHWVDCSLSFTLTCTCMCTRMLLDRKILIGLAASVLAPQGLCSMKQVEWSLGKERQATSLLWSGSFGSSGSNAESLIVASKLVSGIAHQASFSPPICFFYFLSRHSLPCSGHSGCLTVQSSRDISTQALPDPYLGSSQISAQICLLSEAPCVTLQYLQRALSPFPGNIDSTWHTPHPE